MQDHQCAVQFCLLPDGPSFLWVHLHIYTWYVCKSVISLTIAKLSAQNRLAAIPLGVYHWDHEACTFGLTSLFTVVAENIPRLYACAGFSAEIALTSSVAQDAILRLTDPGSSSRLHRDSIIRVC